MTAWEYTVTELGVDVKADLNWLGEIGWECFSIDHDRRLAFFRRPVGPVARSDPYRDTPENRGSGPP